MDALFGLAEMLWPKDHRYQVDNLWSNSSPSEPLGIVRDSFLQAPSQKSLVVYVFSTGAERAALPDVAFSMTGRTLLLCYAIWELSEHDVVNASWHRKTLAALEPYAVGHYVGEADIVANPMRVERSFSLENWQRLQELRRTYDPRGLFHAPIAE